MVWLATSFAKVDVFLVRFVSTSKFNLLLIFLARLSDKIG